MPNDVFYSRTDARQSAEAAAHAAQLRKDREIMARGGHVDGYAASSDRQDYADDAGNLPPANLPRDEWLAWSMRDVPGSNCME